MSRRKIERTTRQQGFSLMELMVVMLIVAILAAVALPSYRNHVIKSNRSAAESFMSQVANTEEQYMLDARTYTSTLGSGGLNLSIPSDVDANYSLSVKAYTTATPPTFSVTAIPKTVQNDTTCKSIAMDSTGAKGAICATDSSGDVKYTGTAMQCTGTVDLCW